MIIKLIGCQSTMNEILAQGLNQETDYTFLDYSFQAQPNKLRAKIQEIINKSQNYDLIILTYDQCSNSILGLISPLVPLLFTATHNCTGLTLGSTTRHPELFNENSHTYYFSQGVLDYGHSPLTEYYEYETKYGEEIAREFVKILYKNYQKAVFIITPGIKDLEPYRQKVREIADFFGWEIGETKWNSSLIRSVFKGINVSESIYVEAGEVITLEMLAAG